METYRHSRGRCDAAVPSAVEGAAAELQAGRKRIEAARELFTAMESGSFDLDLEAIDRLNSPARGRGDACMEVALQQCRQLVTLSCMERSGYRPNEWRIDGLDERVDRGFRRTDDRIDRVEEQVRRVDGRTWKLENRLNFLPFKALLAVLWLLIIAMYVFAAVHH